MRKMKKFFAMLLALTMIMGMAIKSNAAGIVDSNGIPSAADTATVSVNGLEQGMTVTAYQIVEADYYPADSVHKGFKEYLVVDAVENLIGAGYDFENPTYAHITTIANAIAGGSLTLDGEALEYNSSTQVYEKDLAAGAWVIIVDNTNTKMYNPLLAGVFYSTEGISGGNVDVNNEGSLAGLEDVVLYAKSTDVPPLNKVIVNPGSGNEKGDDTAIGDDITFNVTTQIPKYSLAYTDLKFEITDNLSRGLDFVSTPTNVEVTIGGVSNEETKSAYDVTISGRTLKITFNEAGIRTYGGQEVVATYVAELNRSASVPSVTAESLFNKNTVKLEYTNDPSGTTDFTEEIKTYHFTFNFSVKKIDENGKPLEGAKFALYKDSVAEENFVAEGVSTIPAPGVPLAIVDFKGLDAGTYKLVEVEAPDGYQIDTTVRTIKITATYAKDGKIATYTIVANDGVSDYTLESFDRMGNSTTTASLGISNTKLIALPSTGGIGTTIFTVAGCGIMIAAAFFFFANRKKENE